MKVKSGDLYHYHSVAFEFTYITKVNENNIHYLQITFDKGMKIKHYIEKQEYLEQFLALRSTLNKSTFFGFIFKRYSKDLEN